MLITQSNLSQKTFFLQCDYYSVVSIAMELSMVRVTGALLAINETQSTKKHVGSLQLELVVWAHDYDSTSSVWISDAAESDFHPDNIDSRESENPFLEASWSSSSFMWLAFKEFHFAESTISWLCYFVELLIPFLVNAN